MNPILLTALAVSRLASPGPSAAELPPPFPFDPRQVLERTGFQTGAAWSPNGNPRSDVAIVYGIDPGLRGRGDWHGDARQRLAWVHFTNTSSPRELAMRF